MESQGKDKSPHPQLQAILPQLSSIGPSQDSRPVFDSRAEAEQHIQQVRQEEGKTLYLNPVWAIDHTDLQSSSIAGWSVTENLN